MEISQDLQDFILLNGRFIIDFNVLNNNPNFYIEISLDKSQYKDTFIEELDSIVKQYELSIFPYNYKFNVGCDFIDGIILDAITTKYSKVYKIIFSYPSYMNAFFSGKLCDLTIHRKGA